MLATYVSAAFICAGALILGQGVLRLCGATQWTWLSAPVGLATAVLVAVPSLHVPGRCVTAAIALAVLIIAGLVLMVRRPNHRPPRYGLLAGFPVALLTTLPFLSAGQTGVLGWSFNNDTAFHLLWADAYRSETVARFNALPPNYPLGPHALVAVVAQGLGIGVDQAFSGLLIATVLLIGWTALAAFKRPRWWGPPAATVLVGMPYLVAGYYGQGAFKEVMQALLVLGAAVLLAFPPKVSRLGRWVPMAVLLAGTVSVYSFLGLAWPVAFLGLALAGVAIGRLVTTGSARATVHAAGAGIAPLGVAAGALLLILAPQLPRLWRFAAIRNTGSATGVTGIPKDDLGNLAGRLPLWESSGIWRSPDLRVAAADPLTNGIWIGLVVALVAFGAAWAIRRRERMLVAAAAMTFLIWVMSDRTQSPYVAAKALVILCPLVMLVAVRALAERDFPGHRTSPSWWFVAPLLAAVFIFEVAGSSSDALRASRVGTMAHTRELRELQTTLRHEPTLFLGNDDFIRWELSRTPVMAPVIGFPTMAFQPQKPLVYGAAYDVDSIGTSQLNRFTWVIAPRDASASAIPPQLHRVRATRDFVLYRRTGVVADRRILTEGDSAAGTLNCRSATGRRVVRSGGLAAIRAAPVRVAVPPLPAGLYSSASLHLTPGTWDLVTPYTGSRALRVTGPGLRTTLPANFDRPGPRWPIGRIVVKAAGKIALILHATKSRWTPAGTLTYPGEVIAVRAGTEHTVPIRQACGRLVDWYVPGPA